MLQSQAMTDFMDKRSEELFTEAGRLLRSGRIITTDLRMGTNCPLNSAFTSGPPAAISPGGTSSKTISSEGADCGVRGAAKPPKASRRSDDSTSFHTFAGRTDFTDQTLA